MEACLCTPPLCAKVLLALKGGLFLLWLATEAAIGIADAVSVLKQANSEIVLSGEGPGRLSSPEVLVVGCDSDLEWFGVGTDCKSPWKALMSGEGRSAS